MFLFLFSFLYIFNKSLILLLIVLLLELIIVLSSYYSKNTFDNSILVVDGNIIFNNLIKNNISISKFLLDLKSRNVNVFDNNLCILFKNKKMSLYTKCSSNNYINLLFINNRLNTEGLRNIDKDKKWFFNLLISNSCDIDDIKLVFSFDSHLYIIKK